MDNHDLLDDVKESRRPRYSMRSFKMFLISLLLLLLFFALSILNPQVAMMDYVILSLLIGFVLSTIVGFFLSIKSATSKESDSIMKWIGILGNAFFFVMMLGMLAFIVIDLMNHPVLE